MSNLFTRIYQSLPDYARLSSWPADYIDRAHLAEEGNVITQSLRFIKTRMMYLFVFIPCLILDLVASSIASEYFFRRSKYALEEYKDGYIEKQKKYSTIFVKNALALAFCLVGLFNPKLVAFYFTSEHKGKSGVQAGGDYYSHAEAERFQPKDIGELNEFVAEHLDKATFIPVGAGRSQGKQFLPPEKHKTAKVIDLSRLNQVSIDPDTKTASVGAGAVWSDVQLEANKHSLALQVMQASNVFSVGGSIGTNIHGWDHTKGMLSNTIESMTILNAQGQLIRVTPEDELFHLIAGGLGLYGIVVEVQLKLTDNHLLKEQASLIPLDEYVHHFEHQVLNNERVKLHLYRLSLDPDNLLKEGVAVNYERDETAPLPVQAAHFVPETNRGSSVDQVMINLARRSPLVRKKYWAYERDRLLKNDTPALSRNEIMKPPINAMFNPSVSESEWLQEYFLPGEALASFLEGLSEILSKNEVVLLNASVRYVKENNRSPLSYARNGDKYAVVLCFNQSLKPSDVVKAEKWLRKAQHLAVNQGGTFYLPYQHVTAPEDFAKAYPKARKAILKKKEYDPYHRFASGFEEKYLGQSLQTENHFKLMMQSDETKALFQGFLKVVLKRLDADSFFKLLTDILEYKDTHAEIYKELARRLPEIMPAALSDLKHIVHSLDDIKHDLAAQASLLLPKYPKTIKGLVEIGYPGRFVNGFKAQYKLEGPVIAVNDAKPSVTDYIQTGFPRPYQRLETLDYKQPNLKNLEANSADVITCYIGLHHFPEETLQPFLKEVRRVLREGGHFLLVDHDCKDPITLTMAHMAHSVFNVVNGASLEEEMTELRNFQPMSYWVTQLKKAGLASEVLEGPDVPMVREGDPSRNRMVSFVKGAPKANPMLRLASVKGKEPLVEKEVFSNASYGSLWEPAQHHGAGESHNAGLKYN